jgi:hypothetical protein
MVAEKSGFKFDANGQSTAMKELADKLSREALAAMQSTGNVDLAPTTPAPPKALMKEKVGGNS